MKLLFSILIFSVANLTAQSNCKDLMITTDNRTGEIKFECPLAFDMQFYKILTKDGDSSFHLFLQTMVSYTNTNEKGCTLYLSDSSKIEFPEQAITVTNKSSLLYKYSTTLTLSANDIERLLKHSIVDFKMHIHSSTEKPLLSKKKTATQLMSYLRCVVKGIIPITK